MMIYLKMMRWPPKNIELKSRVQQKKEHTAAFHYTTTRTLSLCTWNFLSSSFYNTARPRMTQPFMSVYIQLEKSYEIVTWYTCYIYLDLHPVKILSQKDKNSTFLTTFPENGFFWSTWPKMPKKTRKTIFFLIFDCALLLYMYKRTEKKNLLGLVQFWNF